MNYHRTIWLVLLIATLAFPACVDDNFTDIDTSITYDANFSLPLGNSNPTLGDFLDTINLIPIPPWVDRDTVSFFLYDSIYYYSPGRITLTVSGYFSLDPFENDTVQITSLMFRNNAVNAIPAQFDQQLYFTDSTGAIIDSLYSVPLTIEPALIDSEGNVTATYEIWKFDTYLSEDMINNISNTYNVRISTEFIIPDSSQGTVPFYSSQEIWMQVGIRVGILIELG